MKVMLLKVEGLFRRILTKSNVNGRVEVEVIVGYREMRSSASRSPGSSWMAVPGQSRSWVKTEPRVETRYVDADDILEVNDWPSGMEHHGFSPEQYYPLITQQVKAGNMSNGNTASRRPPSILLTVIEKSIKESGLAMPTQEELDQLVLDVWKSSKPTRRSINVESMRSDPPAPPAPPAPETTTLSSAQPVPENVVSVASSDAPTAAMDVAEPPAMVDSPTTSVVMSMMVEPKSDRSRSKTSHR